MYSTRRRTRSGRLKAKRIPSGASAGQREKVLLYISPESPGPPPPIPKAFSPADRQKACPGIPKLDLARLLAKNNIAPNGASSACPCRSPSAKEA
ncbi:MAG: hypothetical protein BJ554DRAFT_7931 [Olpidium bornovanus]|uniref:Uncharacterized protein n=1 Tax=Olpidium bornovanus TaxID=278681 RepID=A0A8H7ZV84_9FUNG|nr:MAG: hypothetical protein BJ554DRAFT_7931 [Olpidium bornovanus]